MTFRTRFRGLRARSPPRARHPSRRHRRTACPGCRFPAVRENAQQRPKWTTPSSPQAEPERTGHASTTSQTGTRRTTTNAAAGAEDNPTMPRRHQAANAQQHRAAGPKNSTASGTRLKPTAQASSAKACAATLVEFARSSAAAAAWSGWRLRAGGSRRLWTGSPPSTSGRMRTVLRRSSATTGC